MGISEEEAMAAAEQAGEDSGRPESAPVTTAKLKALSNPIRRDILHVLTARRHARATDIGEALGLPSNKVSFHLRVLAEAGMIEEDPERARDRRDRVWKPGKGQLDLATPGLAEDDQVLANALIGSLVEDHQELLRKVVAMATRYMKEGESIGNHGTFMQTSLRLSEEQLETAAQQFMETLRAASEANDPTDDDVRLWRIDIVAADDTL
ncbi:MAG: helix-turn-helix domain-containing protein [Ancrocorticia sp.]